MNGDCSRGVLRQSDVPGDTTVWADVLYDGPVPDVPPDELRRIRGGYVGADEAGAGLSEEEARETLGDWDAALARYGEYDEVVFWFEHDLFDQLILIRHLHWLSTIAPGATRFSLICVGEFPGIPGFAGLGELNPAQLATLFPSRQPITDDQIRLGTRAWNLFRAPEPEGLLAFASNGSTPALPFLAGALRRYFEDFPSSGNGLSRSEAQILRVAGDGDLSPARIFAATSEMEERIFMGDLTFWGIMQGLASAPHPLITIEPQQSADFARSELLRGTRLTQGRVRLTPTGEDVLANRADHIELNGIDKWMGGVYLRTERHWRWDGARLIRVNSKLQTPNSKSRAD